MLMLLIDLAFVALGVSGTLVIQWILRRYGNNGAVTISINVDPSDPDRIWANFDKALEDQRKR